MSHLLGLATKEVDPRTIQYRAIRGAATWEPPASYSYDAEKAAMGVAIPTPMFANDRYGDCVIAARAHQTLRFELTEQGSVLSITDKEVTDQYFKESGGQDSGLVALYSMRAWRKGWTAGGKVYRIHSFLEVQPQDHDLVREATIVGTGLQWGIRLPLSAADQLNTGAPWDVVAGPRGQAGSWGGHMVMSAEYNDVGPVFVTWGKKKQATWRFIDAYADECYMAVDDVNRLSGGMSLHLAEALDNI